MKYEISDKKAILGVIITHYALLRETIEDK